MTDEILPDRDKKAIKKPTLRWALHLLRGVHCVSQKIGDEMRYSLQGMSETKKKIIRLMGGEGMRIYSLGETILLQQRITQ
jgi:hypothetical protein